MVVQLARQVGSTPRSSTSDGGGMLGAGFRSVLEATILDLNEGSANTPPLIDATRVEHSNDVDDPCAEFYPVVAPTDVPVESPTDTPVEAPSTLAPVGDTVPTDLPVKPPTDAPVVVSPSTDAPVESPTDAPVAIFIESFTERPVLDDSSAALVGGRIASFVVLLTRSFLCS